MEEFASASVAYNPNANAARQQLGAAASLNKPAEPRLTALAGRLNVLNERARECEKRLDSEIGRIAGSSPAGTLKDGGQRERGPDAVGLIESNVDCLESVISDILDHTARLQGL